ncbi:MAG: hypothetical protein HY825_05735 [Acidobacteria bacterium]|nr:hypothetical protein [Acidobacteriota bacterium]
MAVTLGIAVLLFSAGRAGAQCANCVKYHSGNSSSSTASNTLDVTFTIPSTSVCADPMLVAALSILSASGTAPALATTTGVRWYWDGLSGSSENLTYQDGASGWSDPTNDSQHKRVEMWLKEGPHATTSGYTGVARFTLSGSNTNDMVGGVVLACGVNGLAYRSFFNNEVSATRAITSLSSADGYLYVDVCAIDAAISATAYYTRMAESWNTASGGTNAVRGVSSRVASTVDLESTRWTLGNTLGTYYACGAVDLEPKSPTAVLLEDFSARSSQEGVALNWHAGREAGNLGYRIYREDSGTRVPVTPEIIAGSALSYGAATLEAGYAYSWRDPGGRAGSTYWLEDVELGGSSTFHGPFVAERGENVPTTEARRSTLLSQVAARGSRRLTAASSQHAVRPVVSPARPENTVAQLKQQWAIAAGEAAKIIVAEEGWYRVGATELEAAGFGVIGSDAKTLQLFADGKEHAIRVNDGGDGSFGAGDSIEFYGVPLDTQWSGSQAYWLVKGRSHGARIAVVGQPPAVAASTVTVPYTVQFKERLIYVTGLLNGDKENFFGKVVTSTAAEHPLALTHVDRGAVTPAILEVALQGFTEAPHQVSVSLNGQPVGVVDFTGRGWQVGVVQVPPNQLLEGANVVALMENGSPNAISLVDYVNLTYPRVSIAENDSLLFSLGLPATAAPLRIGGFTTPGVRVFDVTSPGRPEELGGRVSFQQDGYAVDLPSRQAPRHGVRYLLALTEERAMRPASITANQPSVLSDVDHEAEIVVLSHRSFLPSLAPLKALRESQGYSVAVIDVEDVYDEFGFGVKSPQAIRDFLGRATRSWRVAPRFVLLVGDGSQDPRDYLQLGQDFMPTKLVDTATWETASDDWMADLNADGVPDVALGRFPVDSLAEAEIMVGKLVRYETGEQRVANALFVADQAVVANFRDQNEQLRALLPSTVAIDDAIVDTVGYPAVRAQLLAAINDGLDLVQYAGHGTIDHWSNGLLTNSDVGALTNHDRLPVFTVMNCLTGIFQEPLLEGLGETLVKAENGGAIAVWASSGTTLAPAQQSLMSEFFQALFASGSELTLGEAAARAKAAVTDSDVKSTWILLGDPATRIR